MNLDEDELYSLATAGTPPISFVPRGDSVLKASQLLIEAAGKCVDEGDFTPLLSPDQSAVM